MKTIVLIEWLEHLLTLLPEQKAVEVIEKEVEVKLPEEKKPTPKKKVVFKKK